MRKTCLFILLAIAVALPGLSQITGGHGAGQAIPKAPEKASLGAGPIADNVDLFTGDLSLSYSFGNVATLSGLSFPISLSYTSSSMLGFDTEHNSGIPYGEGWNLAGASVSVETHVYDWGPGELPFDNQSRKQYNIWQSRKSGQLHYANPRLSLPGGPSGKLVYKYPDKTDPSVAIYHLQTFSSYVEVRFDGQKWEARTDDGTVYVFSIPEYRLHNPTNVTAQLQDNGVETIIPQAAVSRWHLSEIYNPNHANAQKILFEYRLFGKQEIRSELEQATVKQYLDTYQNSLYWMTVSQSHYDSLSNNGANPVIIQGDTIQPGDTLWNPTVSPVQVIAYSDIFLSSVTATDGQGQDISRVELKYKSWRPENELASNPTALAKGKFLQLSDPKVVRIDSLYSQKTVWFRGTDHAVSQSYHGTRPAETSTPFSTDWQRYQHPVAHQNPLSRYQPQLDARNPFLAQYTGISGINPSWKYWALTPATTTATFSLPFTHSVLESPRLNEADMPPGDWYELRTLIKLDPANIDADMNFDVRVTSGVPSTHPLVNNVDVPATIAGKQYNFRLAALPGQPSGYYENGHEIYSTTRNIVKWNPAYQKGGSYLATRNRFRLGNLPNEFEGFSVQIGPGADNLKHHLAHNTNDSYFHYYSNFDNALIPTTYHNLNFGTWFGTGAPLEPLFRTDRFGLFKNNNRQKGMSGDRFLWWMLDVSSSYSQFQLQQEGPNQPTALTHEKLSSSISGTYFFNTSPYISQAHDLAEDSHLQNVELVRIAKNPYMLDSVIVYIGNGNYGVDRVAVAAYKLEYELQQVPVLNNVDRTGGNPIANIAGSYRIQNGDTLFRNMFQLTAIRRLDTDSTGQVQTPVSPAITRIEYMQDDPATIMFNEAYLAETFWTELGGKQSFAYNFPKLDSVHLNQSRYILQSDQSHEVIGSGNVVYQRVPISKKIVEVGGSTREIKYEFQNPVMLYRGYSIDPHFNNGKSNNPRSNRVWGYSKAIVRQPLVGPGQRVKAEHTFHTATASHVDTLLFGKLAKVEEYDANGDLTSSTVQEYEASLVYLNGQHYKKPSFVTPNGHQVETSANAVWEYEGQYLFGHPEDRMLDSWFIVPKKESKTVYDVNNGNFITNVSTSTYFDWDAQRKDTEGDYDEMYRTTNITPWFSRQPYFDAQSKQFTYHTEPSWQVASKRSTSTDHPGAFTQKNFYYLWDIEPFLSDFHPSVERFEGSLRPFYLARKYGIRNTAYEEKSTSFNGNPDLNPISLSTYFEYSVFDSVGGDFVWDVDSSGYGRLCEGDDGGPMSLNRQAATYCFGEGRPIQIEEMTIELLDDPRYVKDGNGQYYFFPIESYTAVDLAEATSPQPDCPGGLVMGLHSEAVYFGSYTIEGGGSLDASNLVDASRNYGIEGTGENLTEGSQEKSVLLAFLPHCHDSLTCDMVHGFDSDSTMTRTVLGDSSGTPNNERQIFIDMLEQQYFLRAVYQQADTIPNHYFFQDSLNNQAYLSPHNLWDTLNVGTIYHSTPYRFTFRPVFPTIRTYKVHYRNMHGQILDESDARHLHTLYEYSKGLYRSWFDRCGVHHTALARWNFGFPRSVTVTDFEGIEHVSRFDYYRNNSIKRILAADSSEVSFAYDGQKRLSHKYINGLLRERLNYSLWDGNTNASWDSRTGMNYVEAIAEPDQGEAALHTREYLDPLGRNAQTVTGFWDHGIGWEKAFTGRPVYDAWDRTRIQHRPYAKTMQSNMDYDPVYTITDWSEFAYENAASARQLRASKPGNNINSTAEKNEYTIISVSTFQTETGASWNEVKKLYPTLGAIGISGGGSGGGGATNRGKGKGSIVTGPSPHKVYLFKTQTQDEDGKRTIVYQNASGQRIATLSYTDPSYKQKILTIFLHDARGNIVCTIHPNKLVSETKYNLLGWPYESHSPDRGMTRLFYNQAGDLRYSQDARRRLEGNVVAMHYDRLGRAYREEIAALGPVSTGNNMSYYPLVYRDTLGITFSSIQTFVDELWLQADDENADNSIFNDNFNQKSFPVLQFSVSSIRKLAERRYDYSLDSVVSYSDFPNPALGLQHPAIPASQAHTVDKLVAEAIYDENGQPIEISYLSYTNEGQTDWLLRQIRPDGINGLQHGKAHRLNYQNYDRRGRLHQLGIDLGADGINDITHSYTFDDWGRLQEVRLDEGNGPRLIARHDYDPATGNLTMQRNYTWNDACTLPVVVDSLVYQYDAQDRTTGMHSRMLDYGLFYDAAHPNQGLSGQQIVQTSSNYNGAINGLRMDYKVAPYGVTGFNSATVYGFQYDGLNRLIQADASVLEHNLLLSASGFDANATFGTNFNGTQAAWYGDARYEYDKAGNLTGLKRYAYFAPGVIPTSPVGDNWQYLYQGSSNRLAQLVTSGQSAGNFTYDPAGNLMRDSRADVTVIDLDHRHLPTGVIKQGDSTRYLYGQEDARIWKSSGPDDYVYYLRDAAGKQIAIWSQADTTWAFELYGVGLIGEYTMHADSSDSTARMAAPGSRMGNVRQWLRRGRTLALGAVAGWVAGMVQGRESQPTGRSSGLAVAVPLLSAVVDIMEDAMLPPPSNTANQRVHSAQDGPDLKFFVKDHLGNVRVAYHPLYTPNPTTGFCDLDFDVASVMDYYPYGKLLRSYFADQPERVQTTEHERDAESGWDFRGARLYSSDYGRFLSVDPLAGQFPSWSPYNYVLGNPIALTDPDGRAPGDPPGRLYTNTSSARGVIKNGFNATDFGKYSTYNWFSTTPNAGGTGRVGQGTTLGIDNIDVSKAHRITKAQTTAWRLEAMAEMGYSKDGLKALQKSNSKAYGKAMSEITGAMYSKVGAYMNQLGKDAYFLEKGGSYAVTDAVANRGVIKTMQGSSAAMTALKGLKAGGLVLGFVAVGADMYEIYSGGFQPKTIASTAGSWAGAYFGASLGAELGAWAGGAIGGAVGAGAGAGPGSVFGGVVGSIVGGAGGYFLGKEFTELAYDVFITKGVNVGANK